MKLSHYCLALCLSSLVSLQTVASEADSFITRAHAITLYDEAPKYAPGFKHFDYVNPKAPKGGKLRQAPISAGTFDSFHPYIAKGNPVATGAVETLMTASLDEPFTNYGLLAESVEWPKDRSWVTFYLNPNARWHDGKPVLADDVVWTFNSLVEKGLPLFRYYYGSVDSVEKTGERSVKFIFNERNNRELPLIIGQLPVLPKHYWATRDFSQPSLEAPMGSGPYQITSFEPGRYTVKKRVANYWGAQHPTQVGLHNFDEIRTDYFRDATAIRLALKSGDLDWRQETTAKSWATEYNTKAIKQGLLIKDTVKTSLPKGMLGLVFNTRRAQFEDPLVREALSLAFDFEWTNERLFYNQYTRTRSYFENSEMAARGLPSIEELALLMPYKDRLPARVFDKPITVPTTDGKGWPRQNLLQAKALLEQSDWQIVDGVLRHKVSQQPFQFELLLSSQAFERILLPYVHNLKRLGIDAKLRLIDTTQYINRLRAFEFDSVVSAIGQSQSPGNEQRNYWGSAAADQAGSRNYAGIKDPVVDELIEKIIQADNRTQLTLSVKALDRVLLNGFYYLPNWHLPAERILYWDKFSMPKVPLPSGVMISRWWYDSTKAEQLERALDGKMAGTSVAAHSPQQSPVRWWLLAVLLFVGAWMLRRYWRKNS